MTTKKTPKTTPAINTLVGTKATPPASLPVKASPASRLPTLPTSTPNKVADPSPKTGIVTVQAARTADATLASDTTLTPKGAFPDFARVGARCLVIMAGDPAKVVEITILSVTDSIVGDDGTFATSGDLVSVSHPRDVFPANAKGKIAANERAEEATLGAKLQKGWSDFRDAIIAGVSNTRDEVRLRASLANLPRVDRARVAFALTGRATADVDACVAAWKAKGSGTSDESRKIREAARDVVRAFRASYPDLERDVATYGSMATLGVWGYPPVKKVAVKKVAKTPVKKTPTTTPTPAKKVAKRSKSAALDSRR